MSYLPGWTDVQVKGKSVGFVYMKGGKWRAVVEKDGKTGEDIGVATSKQAAIDMVKAAYLRS